MIRRFLSIPILLLLLSPSAWAVRTFYIDYNATNNSANGTSKSTPWKTHPSMNHSAGCDSSSGPTYTHQAGDQFIFKGGVTWPLACFPLSISLGGTSSGVQDYYGVDLTWFAGGSFARPLFDMANGTPAGSIGPVKVRAKFITFDNIEIAHFKMVSGAAECSQANIDLSTSSTGNITMKNLLIHDWTITSLSSGSTTHGSGSICQNGGAGGNVIDTVTMYDTNTTAAVPFGACFRNMGEIKNSDCEHTGEGEVGLFGPIHDSTFANINGNAVAAFDPANHTNILETGADESVTLYNLLIHDTHSGVTLYIASASGAIYNLVMWNNANQNIKISAVPISGSESSSTALGIYNSSIDCSNGTNCFGTDAKGTLPGSVNLENNIFITNGTAICVNSPGVCSAITTFTNRNNYTMPTSEANTYGFTPVNKLFPTNVNDSSVQLAGTNLTPIASGAFASLTSDTTCSPWFGNSSCVARPANSSTGTCGGFASSATPCWDDGAYVLSNATGPTFLCSPSGINWPNQPLGYSFNPAITISCTNFGSVSLTMTSIALLGGNTGDFSFTTNPAGGNCGTTLAANATCTISVSFLPTALGNRSTTIVFTDSAPTSPQSVTISGTASYFVQGCTAYTAGPQSSTSCTFPANQIGKSNYCTAYLFDTSDTITTMADGTNTYNPVAAQTTQTSNGIMRSFLATGIANGSAPTVTVNFGSSSTHHGGLNCGEYIVVNALDQTLTATGQSTSPSSGNMTIPGTNEVLVTTVLSPTQAASPSAGWTQRGTANDFYADQIQSAGTYAGTASFGSSDFWIDTLTALTSSAPQVATPTFSPVAGTYTTSQTVTISDATGGATICYTTDGSTPTANGAGTCTHGTTYSGTVSVTTNETLMAIGSKSGNTDSLVGSAAYVIAPVITTPTFSPVAGTYAGPQTVTFTSSGFSPTFCSTLDGSTPTTDGNGTCTHGASGATVMVNASLTVKVIATESGDTDSSMASAAYTITTPTVAAPTFTPSPPAPNTAFHFTATITISSATSGATITYTTDGSTPVPGSHGTAISNGGTVVLSNTFTILSAIGSEGGYNNSTVTTGLFVISGPNSSPAPISIYPLL
jgi:hypothetical protein